jgi:hypothetical protein
MIDEEKYTKKCQEVVDYIIKYLDKNVPALSNLHKYTESDIYLNILICCIFNRIKINDFDHFSNTLRSHMNEYNEILNMKNDNE